MMAETGIGYGGEEMNCVVLRMNQYLDEHKHLEGAVQLYERGTVEKGVCIRCEHEKLFNNIQLQKQFVSSSQALNTVNFARVLVVCKCIRYDP